MYTAIITKKEILEQHEYILLTVELSREKPVEENKKEEKRYVMDGDKPKLDKDGNPKEKKVEAKPKKITKTIYFKFPIETTWETMKADIKKRIDHIKACESQEIPMNTPIDFSTNVEAEVKVKT